MSFSRIKKRIAIVTVIALLSFIVGASFTAGASIALLLFNGLQ